MNYSMISYILGWIFNFEAAFMLLPGITAIIYRERDGLAFLVTMIICLAIGIPLTRTKRKNRVFHAKEGAVTVALSWLVLSIAGALPFVISGSIPHPVDALFETVSGFTTTGASILSDVESLSHCILLWRSFTHWIGGMGVLVFILCLLPLTGGYHMNLMKAESPGPSVSKLVPKVQSTAKILYTIYILMTVVEMVFLLLGGMPLFDTLCLSFGTAGTGGFGIKNDSIASYSTYNQIVITVFMILFGVNFNAYYLLLSKKVIVKGYVKAGGSIKNAENTEEPIRYTQEEQNYLNLYEQDLKGLRDGDPLKELLPAILTMAKEMHRADIYIGDLVQEGNMGLMLAMEDHADDTEALLSMAKESMQALLESQEETKKQDNRMVEKVNDLDEQIKKLSDELGRKVSVDELEEFAGITEDEISNILKLAGEELPPEEK